MPLQFKYIAVKKQTNNIKIVPKKGGRYRKNKKNEKSGRGGTEVNTAQKYVQSVPGNRPNLS